MILADPNVIWASEAPSMPSDAGDTDDDFGQAHDVARGADGGTRPGAPTEVYSAEPVRDAGNAAKL